MGPFPRGDITHERLRRWVRFQYLCLAAEMFGMALVVAIFGIVLVLNSP